ncbi:ABC transporter permease [Niveispirillum lacus]|uniref:ABC transporter permease n=1 Tax=Niveispirillum lacus TaxID=1981099 RepID=A0A255Z283_9PROT|nr:DUF4198 domain-containing protein [Niveispirillum lacus]OYQ35539.1 ABC transporter permease [Niveispirillum lacus]
MKSLLTRATLALTLAVSIAGPAAAHRQWMLPSATILSGQDPWITVDAAVSNDLFYFEHVPLRLDGLTVTNPDGSAGTAENQATGKYRSTFDVHLSQPGTYKVALASAGIMASWEENGQRKRWRGTVDSFAKEVPANAEKLQVTEGARRLEFFATAGKPTETVLKPTGKGLELAPVTHPNDLVAGEQASFTLLLDGKPASDVEVTVIPGGIRYRNDLGEMKLKTDKDGAFTVTWPTAGMYWMTAQTEDKKTSVPQASKRSATYTATFEVMAP